MPVRSARLLQQLQDLGRNAIQGNLVEMMMKCGTPTCGCHKDPSRRHGPHLYLKFRDTQGRSRSLYIPRTHEQAAREAVEAWRRMWEIMLAVSQENREAMREQLRRKRGSRG